MEKTESAVFIALEYDKHLPKLDLHGIDPNQVENSIINFLLEQINQNQYKAQIIYGRGGTGILRQKTIEFLQKNMAEKIRDHKLVKAWKESVLAGAGGRCLILLET